MSTRSLGWAGLPARGSTMLPIQLPARGARWAQGHPVEPIGPRPLSDRAVCRRRPPGSVEGMTQVPTIELTKGVEIPQLGFGVFQIPPAQTADAAAEALRVGYRHIDTAQMYRNEAGVGQAVRESGLPRAEVFVTSKLSNRFHDPDQALA